MIGNDFGFGFGFGLCWVLINYILELKLNLGLRPIFFMFSVKFKFRLDFMDIQTMNPPKPYLIFL